MSVVGWMSGFFPQQHSYEKPTPEDNTTAYDKAETIKNKFRDDDLVASLVNANVRGTVGVGLNIRSNTRDYEYDKLIDANLEEWGEVGNCEISGRFHFRASQRLFQTNYFAYGGVLVRHHFNHAFKFGYMYEMIDINRINSEYNEDNYRNGIATDKYGRITFIRLFIDDKFSKSISVSYKNLTMLQMAWDDLHRYSPLSQLSPVLNSTEYLKKYGDATLKNEEAQAHRGVIIGSKFYASLVEYYNKMAEKARGLLSTDASKSKQMMEEAKGKIDALRLQSVDGVQYIPEGDEVHNMNIMNNTNFQELNKETKKTISSSVGINAMDAYNDDPSSYNAALLGANKSERTYSMDADDLFSLLLKEIVSNAIIGFKMKGIIKADDFYQNKRKYINITYDRRTTSHIDPVKVEKAIAVALENGTTTLIDEASKNGLDWREQLEKNMRYKMAKKEIKKKIKKEKQNG